MTSSAAGAAAVRRTSPLRRLESCEELVFTTAEPARRARYVAIPDVLHPDVHAQLVGAGIERLYEFQGEATDSVLGGQHVVLAGGTGSGKSLGYQLPALHMTRVDKHARVLYLSPTKALAQDQARRLRELGARWLQPALYDGDTPQRERVLVRRNANFVLTNPDMLSMALLPRHGDWAHFFARLQLVVIDEAHVYRGVFGSHVANVLRRLRRVCAHYGADPVFVASSATIANPQQHFVHLSGLPEPVLVSDTGAPGAGRDIALWNPELDEETGHRASALGDAARVYSLLLEEGVPTIVFTRTRKTAELIHTFARDRLRSRGRVDLASRIAPYRAGYTPEQRRATERALAKGDLVGVVATNALELGIDIGELQASVCVTFPGSVTSMRQQWGRAGRGKLRGLGVMIGGEDALDQYFMRRPRALVERPIEHAVLNHANPRILEPHLAAAACEVPLTQADDQIFGAQLPAAIEALVAAGRMRTTDSGTVYCGGDHPAGSISLRSTTTRSIAIVEHETGDVLGTVELERANTTVYPGAVYLHQGESYVARELDLVTSAALVSQRVADYYTLPKTDTDIAIVAVRETRVVNGVQLTFGTIVVHEQLVAYQRRSVDTHSVIDTVAQTLPPTSFATEGIWFAAPPAVVDTMDAETLLGSLHAAEHGMIAMLPLLAMCDRNDIGGLSTDWHQQVGAPAIFVYDGHDGGVGINHIGFQQFEQWVGISRVAIAECPCDDGCPSCVQSPKCGNLNEPLDKRGAVSVLESLQPSAGPKRTTAKRRA